VHEVSNVILHLLNLSILSPCACVLIHIVLFHFSFYKSFIEMALPTDSPYTERQTMSHIGADNSIIREEKNKIYADIRIFLFRKNIQVRN
jgi:hypothetical protein